MFKNYFKIAIAVLKRRKFFTFISLFGISLTLTTLIVLSAFMEAMISPNYPDVNRSRELFIKSLKLESLKGDYSMSGSVSFYFINDFVTKMKTPEKMALHSYRSTTNAYPNNRKLELDIMHTDVNFWEVYQFKFLEGKPFNEEELKNAAQVAVISKHFSNQYFGEDAPAIGKYLEVNNEKYKVIGIVKTVPSTVTYVHSDVYLPYTLARSGLKGTNLMGSYLVTLLAKSAADLPAIQAEYQQLLKKVPHNEKGQDILTGLADNYLDSFTRYYFGVTEGSATDRFYLLIGAVVFLFLLLPTINLMNINVSRIMERSSEIGVRKAFGASSRTLIGQFLIENMILTVLGAIIGLLLSVVMIHMLNSSGIIANMNMQINFRVLCYSLLACLVFGLMSGVYPAWRMSKLNVVTALKANN
ncbi:ABC transporter permease [Pedobacter gandavensis]|uniref:ABC transporter permease n=1 Tax=Pedobacter gandavensis TaxID=2679963 RepID=UPI00247A0A60|nr:ABC transporter permease [Pedobacter gandavensis]WGQ07927.1 ABC transporter permease [Pedobacter gandavensis]